MKKINRRGLIYYIDEKGSKVSKECTKCRDVKPMDQFTKHKRRPDGHSAQCKVCMYEKNREYKERNLEKIAEYKTNYYKQNKEKEDTRVRKWRDENRERHNQRSRVYKRNWRQENPERTVREKQRRRARELYLPDTLTQEQIDKTSAQFDGGCALTGEIDDVHWDHVIPLSTGKVGTIYGNMIPLRCDLNMSKNDKNIFEWFESNQDRFNIPQEKFDSLIAWLAETNGMTIDEYRAYVYECHEVRSAI